MSINPTTAIKEIEQTLKVAYHAGGGAYRYREEANALYDRIKPEFDEKAVEHYIYALAELAYHDYAQLDSDALERWVAARLADIKRLFVGENEQNSAKYYERKGPRYPNPVLNQRYREERRDLEPAVYELRNREDGSIEGHLIPIEGIDGAFETDRRLLTEDRRRAIN